MTQNRLPSIKRLKIVFIIVGFFILSASLPIVSGLMKHSPAGTALLVPNLSATKTAALDSTNTPTAGDLNGNGLINPGDRLTYAITIPNSGPDAALEVSLSDQIDANTTLLNGSVIASPIAVNDTYSSIGNVGITVPDGASDLLSNDLDANNPGNTSALVLTKINNTNFSSGTAVPTTNGAVTVNSDGSFSYTPNPGFEGTSVNADSFTYTLSNGTGLTDTSTVSINVSGMIWFVNNDAPACTTLAAGCGRLSNPFSSLAAFQALNNGAGTNPSDGDSIFVYSGSGNYTGGVVLRSNQKLIGQGALETILAITGYFAPSGTNQLPNTNGTRPVIINTTGNAIAIANDNDIRGLTANAANNAAIAGSGKGGTTAISNIGINASATGGGISLNNQTGTLTISNSSITSNSSGTAVLMSGNAANNANVTFSNIPISQTGGRVIDIQTKTGGTIAFNNGSTVNGTNGTTDAIVLRNNTGGTTITFSNTVNITTTSSGARALQTDNSTGNFTLNMNAAGNTLSSTGGAAMDIEDVAANLSFTSVSSSNSTTQGIRVNNTTGSIVFGNAPITGSDNTGVLLSSNASTLTFGDLDITPDANQRALQATNNTGTLTTTSGTINNSGNVAVEITTASGTTPLNVQLTSVSANGGTNGIILTNTSSSGSPGGFHVLGAGSPGTGGTISSAIQRGARFVGATGVNLKYMTFTGNGTANLDPVAQCGAAVNGTNINCAANIDLQNVTNVTLTNIIATNSKQIGINGKTVANLTLNNVEVSGNGDETNEDGVQLADVTGTITWTGINFHDNKSRQLELQNGSGTLNLTINGTAPNNPRFTNAVFQSPSFGQQGILFSGHGNANMTLNLQNAEISRTFSSAVHCDIADTATANITVNNATLIDVGNSFNIAGVGSGNLTYALTNNSMYQQYPNSNASVIIIQQGEPQSGTFTGTISGNTIGNPSIAGSAAPCDSCHAISVRSVARTGTHNVTISNNTIQRTFNGGIYVASGKNIANDNGTTKVAILNNTIKNPDDPSLVIAGSFSTPRAIHVENAAVTGDTSKTCADILNNVISDTAGTGTWDTPNLIRIAHRNNQAFSLPNYGGASNGGGVGLPNVVSYINGRNNYSGLAGATASATAGLAGGTFVNPGANCSLGTLPPPAEDTFITNNNSVNDLNFLNSSNRSASEIPDLIKSFVKHSANTMISFNEENDKAETMIESGEMVSASKAINAIGSDYRTKVPALFGYASKMLSEVATRLSSSISPTVSAQESKITASVTKSEKLATTSVDTINKPLGTLPAGEQIVIQFKVTVDSTIPANDFSVSNQASISADGIGSVLSDGDADTNGIQSTVTGVVQPPSISKAFGAQFVSPNGTTSLTFTLSNGNLSQSLSQLTFTDTFPAGLVVASPLTVSNTCNGTLWDEAGGELSAGDLGIKLVDGTSAANGSCTITINVTGTTEGAKDNVTTAISSLEGGLGLVSNTATLTVINPPTLAKSFTPNQIQVGATSALQFTLANPNTTLALNTLAFTNSLPDGVTASDTAATTVCTDGSYSVAANVISFTKPSLAAGANCQFSVTVTGTTAGLKTNTTSTVTTANSNAGTAATSNLTVFAAPSIIKAFNPSTISRGGTSTVTLTLTNSNTTGALTNASFSDTLTNMIAVGGPVGGDCQGIAPATLSAGDVNLSFTGITIPNNGSCTVTFMVTSSTAGSHPNTTGGLTTNQTTVAGTASNTVNLIVLAPPTITKAFSPDTISVNGVSTLSINITNPAANTASLTGVAVTDDFPTGMQVAAAPDAMNSCSAGSTFAPLAGAVSISISGVTIPANTTCTFTVKVKATIVGTLLNTTQAVMSSNAGAGETAAATLTVEALSISGVVKYGNNPMNQMLRFVPGVLLSGEGASDVNDTTDSDGKYQLDNLTSGGEYTVTPSKSGDVNGISGIDATLVLRCLAAMNDCTLTESQKAAGDADGSGGLSPIDATMILRFAAAQGATNETGNIGQWKFLPEDQNYSSVTDSLVGKDYEAILIGEVSGNWTPPSSMMPKAEIIP